MSREGWLAVAVVALATLLVHAGTFDAGFVYDDHRFIEFNPALEDIQPGKYFSDPVTASNPDGIVPDIYRPLRTLLFSLEFAVFGAAPTGWHVVSVLLHALNAVLVLLVLHDLLRGGWIAPCVGALLFGLHPVTSESVAWVSSQGDLLALTFMLIALLVLRKAGIRRSIGGVALFALACFSKENALVLPALVWLYWIVLRSGRSDDNDVPQTSELLWRVGALSLVALAFLIIRSAVVPSPEGLGWMAQVPHADGVSGSARGMLHGLVWYGQMLLAPARFTFDIRFDIPLRWSEPGVVLGLGMLTTVVFAGLWGLRRRPMLAFATLGFLACLVPVCNVIVPLKAFVAERFLYPGLVCVVAGLAWALTCVPERWRTVARLGTIPILIVLAVLTTNRNDAWSNEESLWRAVREDRPDNANSYQGLAFEYAKARRVADAERAFRSYLEFNPYDGKSQAVLGNLFGEVAASLQLTEAEMASEGTSNIDLRRKQARVAQIAAYRRALEIWAGGRELGRGSEELEKQMLLQWMDAAQELGDVLELRFANNQLIVRERIDPNDPKQVMRKASLSRRIARVRIAFQAIATTMDGRQMPKDPATREKVESDRAVVLKDVGLDPSQSSKDLLVPLLPLVDGVLDEAVNATPGRATANIENLARMKVGLLLSLGRKAEATAFARRLRRMFPKNAFFGAMLENLLQANQPPPGRPPARGGRRK